VYEADRLRDATFYASSLLELHKLGDAAERRAAWRQSMAALARAVTEDGPGPLEGLHPDALLAGVRAALQSGLVDDLDWLAAAAAGSALYELASALPVGAEQREVGRRVLARLLAADAATFAAIARRMALGAGKGLASPGIRARVALVTELPIGLGVDDGPLALAIASRRDLARDWIAEPSTGSLPALATAWLPPLSTAASCGWAATLLASSSRLASIRLSSALANFRRCASQPDCEPNSSGESTLPLRPRLVMKAILPSWKYTRSYCNA